MSKNMYLHWKLKYETKNINSNICQSVHIWFVYIYIREGPAPRNESSLSCWKNFPSKIQNSDRPKIGPKKCVWPSFQNGLDTWCQNFMVWLCSHFQKFHFVCFLN